MSEKRQFPGAFPTTHWSAVCAARASESQIAQEALEQFGQTYWFPLYSYARRHDHTHVASERLVQRFFHLVVEDDLLAEANPEHGRLRTFLLGCFDKHMQRAQADTVAETPDGQATYVQIDGDSAQEWFAASPELAPDHQFERSWALNAIEQVLLQLGESYTAEGQEDFFSAIRPGLIDQSETDTRAIAERFGQSVDQVKQAVRVLRMAFRRQLEAWIATTVSPGDVQAELRYLIGALRTGE